MNLSARTLMRDVTLLVARVGLGVMMVAHSKVAYDYIGSVGGLVEAFRAGGVPLPAITAPLNLIFEIVGGIAMILGIGVSIVGVLMAANMVGAWLYVHTSALYALDGNGPETVIAIGLLSLVLAVTGSGRLGLDHLFLSRRRSSAARQAPERALSTSSAR